MTNPESARPTVNMAASTVPNTEIWTKPQDCPKWDRCNAPLCPLDQDTGSHLRGEQVCYQLRAAKYGHCIQPAIVSALHQLQGEAPITHGRLASESQSVSIAGLRGSLEKAIDPLVRAANMRRSFKRGA